MKSDLNKRSNDTEASPASIIATRDSLDRRRLARSPCVKPPRWRRSRRLEASRSFISMYAASSGVSLRNVRVVPSFQPLASSRRRFCLRTVILLEPLAACVDDGLGRRAGLVAEDLQRHDRLGIRPIDDSPVDFGVTDPQLMAAGPHHSHWSRVRHAEGFPFLEPAEQITRLQPRWR